MDDNTWTETALTWGTQPALSTTALAALDAGSITANTAKTYTWTDPHQGDLSTWLESQRTTPSSLATLVLAIENSANPGITDVFFEDREDTGAAYDCPDALTTPILMVGDGLLNNLIYLPWTKK